MNRYWKLLTGALLVTVLCAAGSLWAAKEKEKKPKFAKIESVDATKGTVTITDLEHKEGSNMTFTVDSMTKIIIEGKPGKLADVASDMKAEFNASGTKLSRLEVSAPPEEKEKKTKK